MAGGGRRRRSGPATASSIARGAAPHTIYSAEGIDVLAFGTREHDESLSFPQLGLSLIGHRAADTEPGAVDGVPIQFRA